MPEFILINKLVNLWGGKGENDSKPSELERLLIGSNERCVIQPKSKDESHARLTLEANPEQILPPKRFGKSGLSEN